MSYHVMSYYVLSCHILSYHGLVIDPAPPYYADVQVRPKFVCVWTTVLGFRGL
jgi:hypothetical protein